MGAGKVLGGLIVIVIGLALFADSLWNILPGPQINWISNFVITVTGVIPIFLIIIGLFVVWLEVDDMKVKKELKNEPLPQSKKEAAEEKPPVEHKKEEKPNVELKTDEKTGKK